MRKSILPIFEYNATVVLYIMAKNKDIAEQIDREILSRSVFGP